MLSQSIRGVGLGAILMALCVARAGAEELGKIDLEVSEISAELVGRPVFTMDGQEVGTVRDLLLDDSGVPVKLHMTTGAHLGFGPRTVEVAGEAFMTLRGAVVLDVPAPDVALLPEVREADELSE